ncbi:hypothetical protein NAP1_14463 [Erythrobacter sp. NAP1]|nr:hypothetical protein NAP1_14463 [Erythrobacter sp. NAP1]
MEFSDMSAVEFWARAGKPARSKKAKVWLGQKLIFCPILLVEFRLLSIASHEQRQNALVVV